MTHSSGRRFLDDMDEDEDEADEYNGEDPLDYFGLNC